MHDSLTLTPAAIPSVSSKAPSIVGDHASPGLSQPAATSNAATKSHTDARTLSIYSSSPLQRWSYPPKMVFSPMNFDKSANPSPDVLSSATST